MNQSEFIELSAKEVKGLNGSSREETIEAWRAGYNFARNFVKQKMATCHMTEFIDEMEEFTNIELDEFNIEY